VVKRGDDRLVAKSFLFGFGCVGVLGC